MKYLLFVLLSFLLNINAFAETIICGKVTNAEDNNIELYYKEPILGIFQFKPVQLVNDSFEIRLDLLDPVMIKFSVNANHIDFFVFPDDVFTFSFDANNVPNTLKYQCKNMLDQKYTTGLSAIESIQYLTMKPYYIKGTGWGNVPDGLMDSLKNVVALKSKAFIADNLNNKKLSKEFIPQIQDVSYDDLKGKIIAVYLKNDPNISSKSKPAISEEALDSILNTTVIEREDLIRNDNYMQFLYWYDARAYSKWIKTMNNGLFNKEFAEENIINFQNQHYQNDNVKYAIMLYRNGHNYGRNADLYHNYNAKIEAIFPNGRYKVKANQIAVSLQSLKSGQQAPQFVLKDLEGKTVALSDFKGKVVYIDFWASWCLPCIMENKEVKKIKPLYKDVVFLYITRDKSDSVWRDAINKQEIEGIHLMGGDNVVFDHYKAEGVPKYVLIDKKGRIVTANAPRPSDAEALKALIDKELMN